MRLGCEATAIDINPVAWFILKCTLEYPQKLAGQKRRLPDFPCAIPSSWSRSSRPRDSGSFHLRVEVAGKDVPSDPAVDAINAVLRTVSPDIEMK